MRKNALIISCYVCVAAAFGAFFRWIQKQAAFEADTGLVIPGSIWNTIAAVVCLAAAAGLLAVVLGLKKQGFTPPDSCETAFRGLLPLTNYCGWLFAALMIAGGVLLLVMAGMDRYHTLLRLLALLAVLTGAAYVYVLAAPYKKREPAMLCLCTSLPALLCCYWLVVSYKLHGTEPSAWSFGFEILALSAAAVAFYYLARYAFNRVRTYRTLFFTLLGAFLCLVTLGDERYFAMKLMFLGCAGMLVLSAWLIVSNMRAAPPEVPAEEPVES